MGNKFIALVVLLLGLSLAAPAQNLAEVLFGKDSKQTYMGQYNYNGKRKNGFGIERYKNGSVYVGDFVEGKVSGRGMLITSGKDIDGVEGATVYVGNWRDGKKNGRGTCYDASGKVVFRGKFANDKPSEASEADNANRSFAIKDIGKDVYLGEMSGNRQDGFGLTLMESGEFVYGSMKNGVRQGIGMVFYTPEVWEVGRWADGSFEAFNNSKTANANIEAFRLSNKEVNKQMRADLFTAAQNFAQAGAAAVSIVNDVRGGSIAAGGGVDAGAVDEIANEDDIPEGRSKEWYQSLYDKWESKAKSTFKDGVRHKATAETPGDYRIVTAEGKLLRTYQRSMEQIRRKAKKAGHTIEKSKYETVSI